MNQYHPEPTVPGAPARLPGTDGEHEVQRELGTSGRAARFYDDQMRDRLNARMRDFVGRQEMFFLSTSGRDGDCDSTFRAGPPGFVRVLDERTIAYPEYRGNGVLASLGNIRENPHVGILMIDFGRDRIGLHVNGRARLVADESMRVRRPGLPEDPVPGRRPQIWVEVDIDEAYIHCSKHIPHLVRASAAGTAVSGGERAWGTDDVKRKGGDFFGVAAEAKAARNGTPLPADAGPRGPEGQAAEAGPAAPSLSEDRTVTPSPAASELSASEPAASEPPVVSVFGVAGPPRPRPARQPLPLRPLRQRRSQQSARPERPLVREGSTRPGGDTAGVADLFGVIGLPGPADAVDSDERLRIAVRSARADRAVRAGLPDPDVWRREAERALDRAHQRSPVAVGGQGGGFRGWFG